MERIRSFTARPKGNRRVVRAALFAFLGLAAFRIPALADQEQPAAPSSGTSKAASAPASPSSSATNAAIGADTPIYTPPPRSISDITAVLDRQKPDPAKIAAAKAIADAQAPASISGIDAARFYYERAGAAGELGRAAQELADIRKAAELVTPLRSSHSNDYVQILKLLGASETRSGNMREAIKVRETTVGFASSTPRMQGALFGEYLNLTAINTRLGNIEAANAWAVKSDGLLGNMRGRRGGANLKLNLFHALVEWTHGTALEGQGKFVEAESYFRRAIALASRVIGEAKSWPDPGPPGTQETTRDLIERDLAINLSRQGRLIEAEIEARRALLDQLHIRGRYSNEAAILVSVLGVIIGAEGRFAEAELLDRVSIDTYIGLGHGPQSVMLNRARRNLASMLVSQARWKDALEQFDLMRQGLGGDQELMRSFLGGNLDFADAALHGGRKQVALNVTQHAVTGRSRKLGEKHYDTAEARGFHAVVLGSTGDQAGAISEFAAAMPILLQGSRQASDDEGEGTAKELRFHQILEGYLNALARETGPARDKAIAEAFRIADAARGRSVQKALAASAARSAVGDPALAALVRREQDTQKRVAALNGLISAILTMPSGEQDTNSVDGLRKEIDQLRTARAQIREEIEKRFPDYVNLIDPKPATMAQVQSALKPGEALIATYVAENHTYVWAIPKSGPPAFAAAALKRSDIEAMVGKLRKSLDPDASTLGEIPPFDVGLAYQLYSALLKPVEAGWKGAKSLLVVPHGALGQLPLGLLVTAQVAVAQDKPNEPLFESYRKVPWLIRNVAVTQLPSVASLATLRATPPSGTTRKAFLGFGDPWFSVQQAAEAEANQATQVAALQTRGAKTKIATRGLPLRRRNLPKTESVSSAELALLPRLPETAEEVRQVAMALRADPQADVFLGKRASEQAVRTMKLDDRRVIMFATHGLVPGDLNGLTEPALALSAPQVTGAKGDGLLTTGEILGLKLNADWVVLSACNTAAGNGAGAEAVSGLGLAFFYAGTRAILVSNWPVETTSARTLTTDLFRREAANPSISRAQALREAMVGLIDGPGYVDPVQKKTVFSYAHPIFWAPFSLVGDGGGATQ